MTAVVPGDAFATAAITKTSISIIGATRACINEAIDYLKSAWDRVQVSRHGAYTSRRARALERYIHSASFARVVAVCLLTPLPILTFVLVQELVPLDAPRAGWRDNYRWFVRSTIIFMVLTLSYIQQGLVFLAPFKVSWRQALVMTLTTSGAYFAVLVVVSIYWVFPIPFAGVLTTSIFTILFFGLFAAVVGWRTLDNTRRLSAHARILKGVLIVETIIVIVYPAFNAIFRAVHGPLQLAFLMVLFLLKVVMRLIMAYVLRQGKGGVRDDERWKARLPEMVVFSIELFHVLYLTACLQGQHVTVWATIGVSLFDTAGTVISVRHLLQRPRVVLIHDHEIVSQGRPDSYGPAADLLQAMKPASPLAKLPTARSLRSIIPGLQPPLPNAQSLRAIVPSSDLRVLAPPRLSTIDSSTSTRFSGRRRSSLVNFSASRRLSMSLAASVTNLKLAKRSSSRTSSHSGMTSRRSVSNADRKSVSLVSTTLRRSTVELVAEVSRLGTLSMIEYFLLVEYVKCIIPAMYGIFQVVVARLPNAAYYPSIANATPHELHQAQLNMVVFVALEVISLTVFMLLLYHHLHFSVLHQLAFVLETAADDIQAKLAMFIPYCFFFFLAHNGVDYTFRFAWVHND